MKIDFEKSQHWVLFEDLTKEQLSRLKSVLTRRTEPDKSCPIIVVA
jgi:hypothetical protein